MKIMTTKKYKELNDTIDAYVRLANKHIKKIEQLEAELKKVKKQLLYEQSFNKAFKQKLEDIIFPNTDERGLSDQETPLDFPDIW